MCICSIFREVLASRRFLLAVCGTIAAVTAGGFDALLGTLGSPGVLEYGFHDTLLLTGISSDAMYLALPVLCTLPYASSFLEEVRSGFIKELLLRTTRWNYLAGKIAGCILSGGLALLSGVVISYGILLLVFLPMEALPVGGISIWENLPKLLSGIWLVFCSAGFWAVFAMMVSIVTRSRYMAYSASFIFYYVLVILCDRYLKGVYIINPQEWITPSERWVGGTAGVTLFLTELTSLCILVCLWAGGRRLEHL